MLVFLVAMLLVICGWLASVVISQRQRLDAAEESAQVERAIVRAAVQRGGRITALDVRQAGDVGIAEIEKQLRRLSASGYCESDLTPDGQTFYIFPAFDDAPIRARRLEKQVLQLAKTTGGLVRLSTIATETELTYVDARQMMHSMREAGICEATDDPDAFRFFRTRITDGGESESGTRAAPLVPERNG
jgi:hypothetical protein